MILREHIKLELKFILVVVLTSGVIGGLFAGLFRYNKPVDILHGILIATGIRLTTSVTHSFFLNRWMKRKSFRLAALTNGAFIFLVILVILIISSAIFDEGGWAAISFRYWLGTPAGYNIILFGVLMSFVFSFLAQIYGLIGGRIFFSFFTGRYHKPIEEERIFMSLDLNSSTAIAERIGHINF